MVPSEEFVAREEERDAAEMALLTKLRQRKAALSDLLAKSSDHWGYEDPVYRFYHQSFKVYYIQEHTRSIVAALADLAPDRPLNPWFSEIVSLGTGYEFAAEHNLRWTEMTRPMLEAFFHARFFLDSWR